MIEFITSKGYQVEISPGCITIWHKKSGDLQQFETVIRAWLYCEGWQDEP